MSATHASESNVTPPASCWRLWVDGCGGFLLLSGDRWSVGGLSQGPRADVCVRADWPRMAGMIERTGEDYFWKDEKKPSRRELIQSGQVLPVDGSAEMTLQNPSPLSNSAVLRLRAPHRFVDHIDAVVLTGDTVLIGPGADCHIQHRACTERAIITRRDDRWLAKVGLSGDFQSLEPCERMMLGNLAITLEKA
ncbi:MAG: hypothetical protein AAGG48_01760 [Planctomycetota bacterium]